MDILAPVDTTGYTRESKDELIEQVRNIISDTFDRPIEAN
jgi:hypothetical protein